MKIALYNVTSTMDAIGSGEVGGVEAYTFRLADALQRKGHSVTLFGGQPKTGTVSHPPNVHVVLAPYIETGRIPNWGTRFRRLAQRLHFAKSSRSVFDPQAFDAVLIFKPYDFITARGWHRQGKLRVVASIHGPEFYPGDRLFAKNADAMYAVSQDTADAVQRRYGVSCPVIPNFLDLSEFPFLERPAPPAAKQIVTLGRLVGWKGISHLIRAFAPVSEKFTDATLTIIGDGPEKTALEAEADRLGMGKKVRFTGILKQPAIREELARSWLFVQPSVGYESFSISTLEAIASGVRVLLSDQVGIARWFSGDAGVITYPARDERQLSAHLEKMLSDSWGAHQLHARAARAVVEREFEADRVVGKIERICSGAL